MTGPEFPPPADENRRPRSCCGHCCGHVVQAGHRGGAMISPPREQTIRFCNVVSPGGMYACELERGHDGRHRSESFSNPPYHEWSSE